MTNENKEWLSFKEKFAKVIWNIFVFYRVPILLVWMAFVVGMLCGSLLQ
jgi:hypothetical protein